MSYEWLFSEIHHTSSSSLLQKKTHKANEDILSHSNKNISERVK